MTEVQANLANIQGNIFGGFNKDHQSFLFLSMPDQASARAWLDAIVDDVATCEEVIAFNNLFKRVKGRRHGKEGVVKATWINVAFTFSGLQVLGADPADLDAFPDDFRQGPAARHTDVGDVDDSDPTNWIPPLRDADVHAIVLVASDDPNDLEEEVANRQAQLEEHGIQLIYRQNGEARTGVDADNQNQHGHEHFGFDDGVSQPGVRDDRVTPPGLNPDVGLPGQDRLWPGEFVLGYPRQTGATDPPDNSTNTDPGKIAQNGPAWTTDGSYLVFRRLHQDVKGFRDFVKSQAAVEGISASLMGAKLVGRYASGCPLEIADGEADNIDTSATDPSSTQENKDLLNDERINAFDYASGNPLRDDSTGNRVPLAAHIRKVYPRNAEPPGEAFAETRRILRRGIAFGKSFDETAPPGDPAASDATFPDDRGLLFLCYQNSISDKFEFLMQNWVNNPDFPEVGAGHDLVIGQKDAIRTFALPQGKVTPFTAPQRWVITSWGGYFFQPSLLALASLAGASQ